MDVDFKKLLIRLSLKAAEESQGSIRDLFLQQALRLEAEIEAFTPKKTIVCTHPGSSLREMRSETKTRNKKWVCTICWKEFPRSEIVVSKWHGRSYVKKTARGKHPRN